MATKSEVQNYLEQSHHVLEFDDNGDLWILDVSSDVNVAEKIVILFDDDLILVNGQICGDQDFTIDSVAWAAYEAGIPFGIRPLMEGGPICLTHVMILSTLDEEELQMGVLSLAVATGDARKALGIEGMFGSLLTE
jgi:hypothetical protein